MTKYMITLIMEAPTAAEAATRVAIDADGGYIGEWLDISVSALDD